MSARKRREAFARAKEAGREARLAGNPLTDNPYKKSAWGMAGAWEIGWQEADREMNPAALATGGTK